MNYNFIAFVTLDLCSFQNTHPFNIVGSVRCFSVLGILFRNALQTNAVIGEILLQFKINRFLYKYISKCNLFQ